MLSLPIGLWVVAVEVGLDVKQLAKQSPKLGDEVLAPVGYNVGRGAMLGEDVGQEDAG